MNCNHRVHIRTQTDAFFQLKNTLETENELNEFTFRHYPIS